MVILKVNSDGSPYNNPDPYCVNYGISPIQFTLCSVGAQNQMFIHTNQMLTMYQNTGSCLDNGGNQRIKSQTLYSYTCLGNSYQKWNIANGPVGGNNGGWRLWASGRGTNCLVDNGMSGYMNTWGCSMAEYNTLACQPGSYFDSSQGWNYLQCQYCPPGTC